MDANRRTKINEAHDFLCCKSHEIRVCLTTKRLLVHGVATSHQRVRVKAHSVCESGIVLTK